LPKTAWPPTSLRVVRADGTALGADARALGDRAVGRRDLLLPEAAGAAPGDGRRVEGRALAAAGAPAAGVRVRVGAADSSTAPGVLSPPTDSAGWFAVELTAADLPAAGAGAALVARALGFAPVAIPADSAAGALAMTLRALAAGDGAADVRTTDGRRLDPVRVTARGATASMLAGFERRRRSQLGSYVTREQIDRRRAIGTAELFGLIPGVFVSLRGHVTMARGGVGPLLGDCLPDFYVDGAKIFVGDAPIDEVLLPQEVQGIEVYRGVGQTPPEFSSAKGGCGVVLLWTRRGGT
ncbi:hypothetical protein PYV61_22880, partial [Roseisolibacter sp. H3M3-2]